MSDEEEYSTSSTSLTRRKKVRRAHRSSVTRTITKVDDALNESDSCRLKQLRMSLTDKLDILLKLDNEIIDMVDEDHLDLEVEQADTIKEKISLAIFNIDEAIYLNENVRHRTEENFVKGNSSHQIDTGSSRERPVLPSIAEEEVSSEPMDDVSPSTSVSDNIVSSPYSSLPTVTITTSVSSIPTTVSTTTSSHSTSFDRPVYNFSPPDVPTTMVSTHASVPVVPSFTSIPSLSVVPQVRLPKLSIKKFNGDLTKWMTFWDIFNSSIHSNPTLSNVDKFNYLSSLLESSAAEAIAGLSLTDANYDEAIATLKKRFGNSQLIVNRHMEALMSVTSVSSNHDIKRLRKLHDTVEAHVRGLKALGVPAESYGSLLTSVLVNKLPSEIRLVVSRAMSTEKWDLDTVISVFEQEIIARERASTSGSLQPARDTQPLRMPTAATFMTNHTGSVSSCVYCNQKHHSSSCTTVTDTEARKTILLRAGRCYACLAKGHVSRDCRSKFNCDKCKKRHHTSICGRRSSERAPHKTSNSTGSSSAESASTGHGTSQNNTALHSTTGVHTPVLLQTARLQLFNSESGESQVNARAILDCGSQRT